MTSLLKPRLIFAGTPEFAAKSLSALLQENYNIIAVFTQPDRPAGRGRKLTSSPVKTIAKKANLPVFQPEKLMDNEFEQLVKLKPDLVIVVAYGLLIPQRFLTIPRLGFINVHASLLPRWRGASPIQHAILSGETETGITLMQMDTGLDTGAMLFKQPCPIHSKDTAKDLHDRLADIGAKTLCSGLPKLLQSELLAVEQDNVNMTYAKKISKANALISWKQSAEEVERQIRAFNPWPVCFSYFLTAKNEKIPIRVWQAEVIPKQHSYSEGEILQISKTGIDVACKKHILRLTQIQLPGKRVLETTDIPNAISNLIAPGQSFIN